MVELRSERNLGLIGSVLILVGSFTGVIPTGGWWLEAYHSSGKYSY